MREYKRCSRCNIDLPPEEFYTRPNGRLHSWCKPCHVEYNRQWRELNPAAQREKSRRAHLKYRYGITVERYDEMFAEQGGACAVCKETCPTGKRLAVDHNHSTGEVRGLLCVRCNAVLGQAGDDLQRLADIVAYLWRYESQEVGA